MRGPQAVPVAAYPCPIRRLRLSTLPQGPPVPPAMNVLYEEEGSFKVGAILVDNDTSLQVEAPHGKRSKIKSSAILFRFSEPLGTFLELAQVGAAAIDADFLWECCDSAEFGFDALARDYHGRVPSAVESAAVLLRLHGAPMYFYKKGRGHYKAAPADALKAALASTERKRLQAVQQARYVETLSARQLPEAFQPLLRDLLYKPDRNTIEVKALEEAASDLHLSTLQLLQACGAVPSSEEYHLGRFLFDNFPQGLAFPEVGPLPDFAALPLAQASAFSIDDATTTEIDDAFSVRRLPDGGWEIGIHIAAPALGVLPGDGVDREGASRLSTIYMPGRKITMLAPAAVKHFSLDEGTVVPALGLYLTLSADLALRGTETRLERLPMAANLRHEPLEQVFNETSLESGAEGFAFAQELRLLWELATVFEAGRDRPEMPRQFNMDYSFYVEDGRVRIIERKRGAPMDKLVAEMMIFANAEWGRQLAEAQVPGIYRSQSGGKVKMSTVPGPHQGLGVSQYAWCTSPLRRYIDLVNQRQIIACARGEAAPYQSAGEGLLTVMRDFEAANEIYNEFQRGMERYWCLRWLVQEGITETTGEVVREGVVKVDGLPLITRAVNVPDLPPGTRLELTVSDIDLLGINLRVDARVAAA